MCCEGAVSVTYVSPFTVGPSLLVILYFFFIGVFFLLSLLFLALFSLLFPLLCSFPLLPFPLNTGI